MHHMKAFSQEIGEMWCTFAPDLPKNRMMCTIMVHFCTRCGGQSFRWTVRPRLILQSTQQTVVVLVPLGPSAHHDPGNQEVDQQSERTYYPLFFASLELYQK